MSFRIFVESSADLSPSLRDEYKIDLVPMQFSKDGETYNCEETPIFEFYQMMRDGAHMTTSAANISDYAEIFEPVLKAGEDILVVAFSSGLSSSCNNAMLAAEELQANYPDRKIIVVDSLCASMGHGLIACLTAQKRNEGATIEEAAEFCRETIPHLCHSYTVDTLKYLHRGGRVSTTVAIAGAVLGIKPIMFMNDEGKLIACGKVRGRNASLEDLANKLKTYAIEPEKQTVFISHGDCIKDAKVLAEMVKPYVKDVVIGGIGPLIGSHSGPGTIALFYVGSHRV